MSKLIVHRDIPSRLIHTSRFHSSISAVTSHILRVISSLKALRRVLHFLCFMRQRSNFRLGHTRVIKVRIRFTTFNVFNFFLFHDFRLQNFKSSPLKKVRLGDLTVSFHLSRRIYWRVPVFRNPRCPIRAV